MALTVAGVSLRDHLVDVVFTLFDENGKSSYLVGWPTWESKYMKMQTESKILACQEYTQMNSTHNSAQRLCLEDLHR